MAVGNFCFSLYLLDFCHHSLTQLKCSHWLLLAQYYQVEWMCVFGHVLFREVKVAAAPKVVSCVGGEMQEAKAQCMRSAMTILKQKRIFWLILFLTQLSSVFQIHLNRFDHYQRRKWMLITVKTVTLEVVNRIKGKKQPSFNTAEPPQWLHVGPGVCNI